MTEHAYVHVEGCIWPGCCGNSVVHQGFGLGKFMDHKLFAGWFVDVGKVFYTNI